MGVQEQRNGSILLAGTKQSSKEVYFCILPDKYEPLIEEVEERKETEEERRKRKDEKKQKRKKRCKKYRKVRWNSEL